MFNRISQFFKALNATISFYDIEFINKNLSLKEKKIFFKLAKSEQKHSLNVAYSINQYILNSKLNYDITLLIKAALLHDIGKIYSSANVIEKSIIVILDKFTKGKLKKFNKYKKVDVYYNHADIAYNILCENYAEEKVGYLEKKFIESLLYLVRNHHNDEINDNQDLNLLKYYDNKN